MIHRLIFSVCLAKGSLSDFLTGCNGSVILLISKLTPELIDFYVSRDMFSITRVRVIEFFVEDYAQTLNSVLFSEFCG